MNQQTEVRDEHGGVLLDRAVTRIARLNSEQAREALAALPGPRPALVRQPRKSLGGQPHDLWRVLDQRDVERAAAALLHDRAKTYAVARKAFAGWGRTVPPSVFYEVWCMEHRFDPRTGAERKCESWPDRYAVLQEIIWRSNYEDENALKHDYQRYRREANRVWYAYALATLDDPDLRHTLWGLSDSEADQAVVAAMRRQLLRDRAPAKVVQG
jgi:hypothetical protein